MISGTILFDRHFEFSDGQIGEKILIVLNNASQSQIFLLAKTTSQKKNKTLTSGCNLSERPPNFFIPKGKEFSGTEGRVSAFTENTWVILDEFFEFSYSDFLSKHFSESKINSLGRLQSVELIALLNCCINSLDITSSQEEMLRATLASS